MQRLAVAVAVLVALTLLGAAGYVVIEGWSFFDALFMTVITLSTVGYREVAPLTAAGQLYTMVLIAAGTGTTLYLISAVAQLVFEGRLRDLIQRRTMQRRIDSLSRHVVVCGFGRFGRVVVEELARAGEAVVVVDRDPTLAPDIEAAGAPYVIGSAGSDDVLERAGVRRARAIVAATGSDAENVFITLAARELSPELEIHARGETEAAVRRLERAGANHVTALFHTAGQRAAASLLQPTVVDFLEIARPRQGEPVDLEEIRVCAGSPLAGQTLGAIEAAAPGVRVVALKRAGERIRVVPEPSAPVGTDDHLVVIGEREPLQGLALRAAGRTARGA
jgi:voltage-gated potassium channel